MLSPAIVKKRPEFPAMTDLQTEVLPNLGVWVLNQDSIIARFIRDRRFAVPRCWSKGDSNCRSHPTKI
jgi:hypothetical protein